MASPTTRVATADIEAAEWHARLGERTVSTRTLEDFFAWRAHPDNDAAYRRVEQTWAKAGDLAADPGMAAAVAEVMDRKALPGRRPGGRTGLIGLASAAAAVAAMVVVWIGFEGRNAYATSIGEQRVLQLTDGSTVRLDTGTRIRVRFAGSERRILLDEGQALFEVAHDRTRPFVVAAGNAEVTAVGTVFDVRRAGPGVRVTLVSGVVDVVADRDLGRARMRAGQQARVDGSQVAVRAVDAAAATGWTAGRLVFADTPLRDAVAEVNRYLREPVVLGAGVAGDTPISGVFRTGDREAFASAAAAGLGLEARTQADGALRLSRRES